MFEIVTEYNKEIFCKCYKVHYKFLSKYNAKRNILLTIMCFVLATIALILGITKPETFHTVFVSVFFYIMAAVFVISSSLMSEKGIKRTVDKIFKKNPDMILVAKYVFEEERFYSIHDVNGIVNYEYIDIIHFEVVDDQIIVLLKNKKFIALNTTDEKIIEFLNSKTVK